MKTNSGMYPNEHVIEIFGEQVKWPGLGPDGKFTNGSFADSSIKPSFIPAETLNLLLDNMQRVIEAAGLDANNIEADQLLKASEALIKSGTVATKPATLVIGTAASGHTAQEVDYLCDGTGDQAEINTAIAALPATGGKVVIREGTYNIAGRINLNKANTTLEGMGAATILKRMFDETEDNQGLVHISSPYCTVKSLRINGNKATYANAKNNGIVANAPSGIVTETVCSDSGGNGIYVRGSGCAACKNMCSGNLLSGICLRGSNCIAIGNICNNNIHGITVWAGNVCTVNGNTCYANDCGIKIYGSSINNLASGNTCKNNENGIYIEEGIGNAVTGNTSFRGTGVGGDYGSSQFTILVYGSLSQNNLVSNNIILGKNYVDSSGNATNTFANNKYN